MVSIGYFIGVLLFQCFKEIYARFERIKVRQLINYVTVNKNLYRVEKIDLYTLKVIFF